VKSDLEIWIEYTKSIERLKKPDIYTKRQTPQYIEKPKVNNNDNYDLALSCITDKRKNTNLSVSMLNKLERRKFRSEATIDLHGYTRNITPTLENFCLKCIVNNIKNIAIISGKGGGILKEAVENWLNSNPHMILGFFEIKDSLGQSGAFGVRLRSK
jgi:DNA-nicking Smr family endonuclease